MRRHSDVNRRQIVYGSRCCFSCSQFLLLKELSDCDRGTYTIVMTLNSNETEVFIHYAYTGQINTPHLCDITTLYVYFDLIESLSHHAHEKQIMTKLNEFTENGLFCSMAWYNADDDIEPDYSFLVAAKYEFMSQHISTRSIVSGSIVSVLDQDPIHINKEQKHV